MLVQVHIPIHWYWSHCLCCLMFWMCWSCFTEWMLLVLCILVTYYLFNYCYICSSSTTFLIFDENVMFIFLKEIENLMFITLSIITCINNGFYTLSDVGQDRVICLLRNWGKSLDVTPWLLRHHT